MRARSARMPKTNSRWKAGRLKVWEFRNATKKQRQKSNDFYFTSVGSRAFRRLPCFWDWIIFDGAGEGAGRSRQNSIEILQELVPEKKDKMS